MAIDLEWQDERGNTLARYHGPAIDQKVWSLFPVSGRCLCFVDPIGDAVFNQAQIRVIAGELDALLISDFGRSRSSALAAIRNFIEQAIGKSHTYLKFIGD